MDNRYKGKVGIAKRRILIVRLISYYDCVFRTWLLPVTSIVILVVCVCYANFSHEKKWTSAASLLHNGVSTVYGIVSYPMYVSYSTYCRLFDYLSELHYGVKIQSIALENRALKNRIAILLGENKQLTDLMHFTESVQNFDFITTRIIGTTFTGKHREFVINAGSSDGVKPGYAVVNDRGIIGRIRHVDGHSATAVATLEHDFSIPALIPSSGMRMVVHGASDKNAMMPIVFFDYATEGTPNNSIKDSIKTTCTNSDYIAGKCTLSSTQDTPHARGTKSRSIPTITKCIAGNITRGCTEEGTEVVTYGESGVIPDGIHIGMIHFVDGIAFVAAETSCEMSSIVKVYIPKKEEE